MDGSGHSDKGRGGRACRGGGPGVIYGGTTYGVRRAQASRDPAYLDSASTGVRRPPAWKHAGWSAGSAAIAAPIVVHRSNAGHCEVFSPGPTSPRLLRGKLHADLCRNLAVHRTNRPRATKNENAELAKAGSAFLRWWAPYRSAVAPRTTRTFRSVAITMQRCQVRASGSENQATR